MSRTIVIGSDENVVRRILYVLSYFIRCNEILENSDEPLNDESCEKGVKESPDIMGGQQQTCQEPTAATTQQSTNSIFAESCAEYSMGASAQESSSRLTGVTSQAGLKIPVHDESPRLGTNRGSSHMSDTFIDDIDLRSFIDVSIPR
jgi:hypothetical protein